MCLVPIDSQVLSPSASRREHITPAERSRRERWRAKGVARVVHPTRGTVVVPCASHYAALLCAAEVWGCHWTSLQGAAVLLAEPGDIVETMPYII